MARGDGIDLGSLSDPGDVLEFVRMLKPTRAIARARVENQLRARGASTLDHLECEMAAIQANRRAEGKPDLAESQLASAARRKLRGDDA